jgi:hypothetical protein
MATVVRRIGPLTLRIGARDVSLAASDVTALIVAANAWTEGPSPPWMGALTETLALAPSGFADPPLELDTAQLQLLRELLERMTAEREDELPPTLRDLRAALDGRRWQRSLDE